jgi:hypothetical protein
VRLRFDLPEGVAGGGPRSFRPGGVAAPERPGPGARRVRVGGLQLGGQNWGRGRASAATPCEIGTGVLVAWYGNGELGQDDGTVGTDSTGAIAARVRVAEEW